MGVNEMGARHVSPTRL